MLFARLLIGPCNVCTAVPGLSWEMIAVSLLTSVCGSITRLTSPSIAIRAGKSDSTA